MGFPWTASFGGGTILAECWQQFQAEVAACFGMRCFDGSVFAPVNSGELGDVVHQEEPTSMHNPQPCPDGVWRVMACDWSGGAYVLIALFLQLLALSGHPMMVPYGFAQRGDGTGLAWGTWQWKRTDADYGHCHGNNTLATPYPSGVARSYNARVWAAITSRQPFGLARYLATGRLDGTVLEDWMSGVLADPQVQQNIYEALGRVDPTVATIWARLNGITGQRPAQQLATVDDLRAPQLFVVGDDVAVWALVGSARAWVNPIGYALMGRPPVSRVSVAHPWAQLPTAGVGPEPLRYVQFSDSADPSAVWAVCAGVRIHVSLADWQAAGKPTPEQITGQHDPAVSAKVAA